MKIDHGSLEGRTVRQALEASLAIARSYREEIADENSILLLQELLTLDGLLGTGCAQEQDRHLLQMPRPEW